jgi:hypothetical protein
MDVHRPKYGTIGADPSPCSGYNGNPFPTGAEESVWKQGLHKGGWLMATVTWNLSGYPGGLTGRLIRAARLQVKTQTRKKRHGLDPIFFVPNNSMLHYQRGQNLLFCGRDIFLPTARYLRGILTPHRLDLTQCHI